MSRLLLCTGLLFGYGGRGGRAALCCDTPCDFEVSAGEVVALMGENGCGKSTLLKTFAGTIPPLAGEVSLCEKLLGQWSAQERATHVALVRMSVPAPDRMTVREFVGLGRTPYSGVLDSRNAEDEMVIENALRLFTLEEFANRPVAELSDGERSRVYLAEAVAQQVKVLLLDEPNAFLDIPRSHALFRMLRSLALEQHMGIVVSMHSIEYAEKYCDRIAVIDNRRVQAAPAGEARERGLFAWTEK